MLQDERTKAEKMVGLLGIDGYMQKELAANPPPAMRPNAEPPRPASMLDQMDERHGKLKSRLGLFSHLYNGGSRSDYGDEDMLSAQKAKTAQDALQQKMGLLQPYINGLSSEDPQERQKSILALSQAGVTEDMMGMLAPDIAAQFNTPTYTKGSYEKIDGVWQLVQQADDGSIKYTKMDPDFTPSSRMMSGDKVQAGLQEYQEASFGAVQNIESIDSVINTMDELGKQDWGPTGIMGAAGEKWRALTGTESAVDMARKQYEGIKTTRAIQNLPPGVASDKDIELVLRPFPSSFTSYDELRDYLTRLKRGEQKIQEYNNFSARYLSNSGMRDGMIDAWDEHWDQTTSEGGRFYEPPKRQPAGGTPTSELPETIRRPNPDGDVANMDDEIESILQGLGI